MTNEDNQASDVLMTEGSIYDVNHASDLRAAQAMRVKADLVMQIEAIQHKRGLTQTQMADLLGIKQPDVSDLLRGRFRKYSVGKILDFLTRLNRDVTIVVTPHPVHDEPGTLRVSIA